MSTAANAAPGAVPPPTPHWLDRLAGRFLSLRKMFADGWGAWEVIDAIALGDPEAPPVSLRVDLSEPRRTLDGLWLQHGRFNSPSAGQHLPSEVARGCFQWLRASRGGTDERVCVFLAASGEEGFVRRNLLVRPLVRRGISALILENPFYGLRRPAGQHGPLVRTVAHQFLMNAVTVQEAVALLAWLRERGHGPLGVSGFSMGGYMACLTAVRCSFPLAVTACAAGLNAAPIYTEGSLSRSVAWRSLAPRFGGEAEARVRLGELLSRATRDLAPLPQGSHAVVLGAERDGFVPVAEVEALHRRWPGSELRWLPGGHVSAYAFSAAAVRQAILDSFDAVRG